MTIDLRTLFLQLALLLVAGCSWSDFSSEEIPTLTVEVLDVGQGDAILVSDGVHHRLIDTGPPSSGLVSRLKDRGVARLEQLFLTHHHLDHLGSAVEVLAGIDVGRISVSADREVNPEWNSVVRWSDSLGVKIDTVWRGDWIDWGDSQSASIGFRVLWPHRGVWQEGNGASLVLQLVSPGARVLLTGDLEEEQERELIALEGDRLASELLKVGHHGSRTGSVLDFLSKVRPLRAAISAGRNNSYGHPHPELLADLLLILGDSSRIHRTDRGGDLRFTIDGAGISAPGSDKREGLVRW